MSWRQLWQQFRKNRAAELSLYLIIGFVLAAAPAHQFSPYDPFALGDETLIAPRGDHWMGTDDLGRDTLSRVIHGTRVPLLVGFLATAASMALGILIALCPVTSAAAPLSLLCARRNTSWSYRHFFS